jgi:type II secretory pathway component PulF
MKKTQKKKKGIMNMNFEFGGVSLIEKALFAKHLSVMLKSGISITEAIDISAGSTKGKMARTLSSVGESVAAGNSLSDSFARFPKVFDGLFVNTTKAGESSGTLVESLENISVQLEKEKELTSKIKGAMVYPVVVLIAAFLLGMALAFLVLPKITPLFEGLKVDLPFTTDMLIKFSHFIQNHGISFFISIIVFLVAIIWTSRQKFLKPFTHLLLIKTPVIKNIVLNANIARFARTLATLLRSGVRIDESLDIVKGTVGNYYYRRALDRVSRNIRTGSKLSDNLALAPELFPVLVTKMVNVGEQSGKFEETLNYLAEFYEDEVDVATKNLSTAIEPVLLIFIGLVVAFLALSIITPIYNITGNVQR